MVVDFYCVVMGLDEETKSGIRNCALSCVAPDFPEQRAGLDIEKEVVAALTVIFIAVIIFCATPYFRIARSVQNGSYLCIPSRVVNIVPQLAQVPRSVGLGKYLFG